MLQMGYYIPISNEIATRYYKKSTLLNFQESKLFTTVGRMYRNPESMYRGDSSNLQSDMSFFAPQIQLLAETTSERLYLSNLDLEIR